MSIRLSVDMVSQLSNPVCWLACLVMVKQYEGSVTISDGEIGYPHGDLRQPTSIENIGGWRVALRFMNEHGLSFEKTAEFPVPSSAFPEGASAGAGTQSAEDVIEAFLLIRKPVILAHHCGSFSYGPGVTTPTTGLHAVVVTGIDRQRGVFYFNNPWGQRDVQTSISSISNAVSRFETAFDLPSMGYLRT